ncbi:MAG: helix-turn-helix transcriptional regulator [Alphaproteobacteria bacterium]|nr:helix-turn-helix transcriptional regulator [Alphaproteobacteria bacterium]
MNNIALLLAPADVEDMLAHRLRAERKRRGWTQTEMATRSGLSIATVARLEQTGQGQLSSLIHLSAALGRLSDFEALLKPAPPSSLEELRQQAARSKDP